MTMAQYSDLLGAIGYKQVYDIQTNTVGMTGEFDDGVNPLYSIQEEIDLPKHMTVEDAKKMMGQVGK